jgi:phosphohistidine phosphatase
MILHLVRHGKTDQFSATGRDYDRELLPRGIAQSKLLGEYIKLNATCQVFCSSAKRTQQTFHYMNEPLRMTRVNFQEDLYLCSREHLFELLCEQEHTNDIMIVGHNFGISDLVSYLIDDPIEMRTGEYIAIEFEVSNWKELSKGVGTILDRYRPRVSD